MDRDRETGFQTIAYDWQSGDLYAIRPLEYKILRFIYEYEPVTESIVSDYAKNDLGESQIDISSALITITSKRISSKKSFKVVLDLWSILIHNSCYFF